MVDAPVNLRAYSDLIRHNRNFRLLWGAQIVSEIGDWLYAIAVYSLILELTGSAQAVALAIVLQVLPQFFFSPAAGVLNDRLSRKRIMIAADWARAVITLLMLFTQTREMLPFLYVLLFLETIFWALFEPGRNSVIPNITGGGRETLVANALASTTWSFNLAIGSAIGGLLAAAFGREAVFVVNALSFVASALLIRSMQFEEPHLAHVSGFRLRDAFDFSPVLEGLRYARRDRTLFGTMFAKSVLGFMGTNWVILPLLGERIYPVHLPTLDPKSAGMLGMSLLLGCRGIGALLGPLIATYWSGNRPSRFRLGIVLGFLFAGAGYGALGMSGSLLGACIAIVVAHLGGSTSWVFSTTLLQLRTEDRYRGRVFSTEFAFHMLIMSVASYVAGVLVDRGMTVWTVALLTGACVFGAGTLWTWTQFVRGNHDD